jgi:RNA polymerase sigma-70 factor (ECF subfamily)
VDESERFTEMFRAFHAQVTAYARRRVPLEAAQDVVAATFLAAWRHRDALPSDPLPWLYRAAALEIASQSRTAHRRLRLWERISQTRSDLSESDHADQIAMAAHWKAAFAALSEGDREVLRLTAWEQLGPKQASVIVGCSPVAFKVRLHRARRRLEALIDGEHLRLREPTESLSLERPVPLNSDSDCPPTIEKAPPRCSVPPQQEV